MIKKIGFTGVVETVDNVTKFAAMYNFMTFTQLVQFIDTYFNLFMSYSLYLVLYVNLVIFYLLSLAQV